MRHNCQRGIPRLVLHCQNDIILYTYYIEYPITICNLELVSFWLTFWYFARSFDFKFNIFHMTFWYKQFQNKTCAAADIFIAITTECVYVYLLGLAFLFLHSHTYFPPLKKVICRSTLYFFILALLHWHCIVGMHKRKVRIYFCKNLLKLRT